MRLSPLLGLLLCFPACFAQEQEVVVTGTPPTAQRPAVKAARPMGRITGNILCGDTRRPARGAFVIIARVPPEGASANAGGNENSAFTQVRMDGTYTAEHFSPGEYMVIASLPGYLSAFTEMLTSQMADRSPAAAREKLLRLGTVSVRGAETERFDITLQRGGDLSGQVLYSDGSPASQVAIDVEDVNETATLTDEARMQASFAARIFTRQDGNTNDQGRFRIAGLKPGTYRIAAVSSQPGGNSDDPDGMGAMLGLAVGTAALHIYAGDTLHKKASTTYTLRSGDEVSGVAITIRLDAFHRVHGTIAASDGRVINKASVTLTDTADDSIAFKTKVDADGLFTFAAIPPGTYTLKATDAQILMRQDSTSGDLPLAYVPTTPTNAFADASSSLLVKDSDLLNATLTLAEVPLPPQPAKPQAPNMPPPAPETPPGR